MLESSSIVHPIIKHLEPSMSHVSIRIVNVLVFLVLFAQAALAQNKEMMSMKMAEADLKRNIVESVIGFKVRSESEFGLTEEAKYKVESKAAAVIKGIKVDKRIYDREKDVALVFGHIELGDVVNVVGELVKYKNVTVQGMGFGSMTEASRGPLRALRAAMLNAYDEMASVLVGEKILSKSKAENFILTGDSNRAKVLAAVYGAHIPNLEVNSPSRGWGWEENGNAFVKLVVDVRKVKDILGQNIKYKGGENLVEVVGQGTQADELNEAGPGFVPDKPKTSYGTLDMPKSR